MIVIRLSLDFEATGQKSFFEHYALRKIRRQTKLESESRLLHLTTLFDLVILSGNNEPNSLTCDGFSPVEILLKIQDGELSSVALTPRLCFGPLPFRRARLVAVRGGGLGVGGLYRSRALNLGQVHYFFENYLLDRKITQKDFISYRERCLARPGGEP